MSKLSLVKGTTSLSAYVFIGDSSVTTGAGKTGLAYNTASLVAYYVRPRAAPVAITLATLAAVTTAFTSGGFIEVDATNMPGIYRLDVPDAALATGVNAVVVMLKGASNMVPVALEIELTGVDNQDAVRMGMTALPNAAAAASGGLFIRGTGAGAINQDANGRIDVNVAAISTDSTAADNAESYFDGTGYAGTNNVIPTVTSLTNAPTNGDLTSTMKASVTTAATAATPAVTVSDKTGFSLSSAGIQAIWDRLTSALTTVGSIGKLLVDNITGDAYARLGAPAGASVSADVAAIQAKTTNLPSDPADQSAVEAAITAAAITAAGIRAAVGLGSANLDTQLGDLPTALESADALLKRDWTAVTGEAARSMLNAMRFMRNKWSISGTTVTVTKEDDTTSAWTATLSTSASADPVTGSDPA